MPIALFYFKKRGKIEMARILVVEDERSIRQALSFELEEEGHLVHHVADYEEAVSAMQAFQYDIVISDIYLECGNGFELMQWAKKSRLNIPFIMITAYPESDLAMRVKEILKDRLFAKPFFVSSLKSKISELLDGEIFSPTETVLQTN
jgi:DNA-binding response OmpR family regulator